MNAFKITLAKAVIGAVLLASILSSRPYSAEDLPQRWNVADAQTHQTATRAEISLNGEWDIALHNGAGVFESPELSKKELMRMRLAGKSVEPTPQPVWDQSDQWQPMRVPGLWHDVHWRSTTQYESLIATLKQEQAKPRQRASNYVKWDGTPVSELAFAWYQRKLQLPADWNPATTAIRVGKVNNEAWVFINDTLVGYQGNEAQKEYPLPKEIKADQPLTLTILVGAYVEGEQKVFLGGDQVRTVKATSQTRGITGDVWLINQPIKQRVENVTIKPSVRNQSLDITFALDHPKAHDVRGVVKECSTGKVVLEINKKLGKADDGVFHLSQEWSNPSLWTPDSPFLYSLELEILDDQSNVLDAPLPERFGFREIWIEGRDYLFNGHPVHFRIQSFPPGPDALLRSELTRLKKMGYNAVETSASNIPFGILDEMGMMALAVLPPVNNIIHTWEGEKDDWQNSVSSIVKSNINHPSVVQWSMNVNLLGYPFDLNPHTLGTDHMPGGESRVAARWKIASQSQEYVESLDPTRPIFHHAGGNFGDAHTSNMYLCFSPLQEKRQWPSIWAEHGVKPFIAVELGTPYVASYFRNRESVGKKNNYKSEPFYDEYAARTLGPDAYKQSARLEPALKSQVIPGALSDKSDEYKDMMGYFYGPLRSEVLSNHMQTQVALGDYYRQWRTWGVSGFNPFYAEYAFYSHTHLARQKVAEYPSLKTPGYKTYFVYDRYIDEPTDQVQAYTQWMKPSFSYIAGTPDNFIDQTHNYYVGTPISKSVIVVNDSFGDQSKNYEIALLDANGDTHQSEQFEISATPGQIIKRAVEFDGPEQAGIFTLVLKSDGAEVDRFTIEIHPVVAKAELDKNVWLYDDHGLTTKTLDSLGIKSSPFEGKPLSGDDLLIVGRESVAGIQRYAAQLRESVGDGLQVLIFEQQAEDLEKVFGLRTLEASGRRVFKGANTPTFLSVISDESLFDWPGKATLIQEYPVPANNGYPKHVYKHGNAQTVASVVIEKPHHGAFRSFLHEGFDLGYTPLLEERVGAGRIIYCQLDVTARDAQNPVGDLLIKYLLQDMDQVSEQPVRQLVYTGDQHGRDILELSGLSYQQLEEVALETGDVLITGDGAIDAAAMKSHLEAGGKVLALAIKDPAKYGQSIGLDITSAQMTGYRLDPQVIPGITDGLGDGDWYWKDRFATRLPLKDQPIASYAVGSGQLIVCQVDPLHFEGEMHQRRHRSQAKLTRIVSTVLGNLGARSKHSSLDYAMNSSNALEPIDLSGEWVFKLDPTDIGAKEGWSASELADTMTIKVPGSWESQGVKTPNPSVPGKAPYDGIAWYQYKIEIPDDYKGVELYFDAGSIDDCDTTFFNGQQIGATGEETPESWDARRRYLIPPTAIRWNAQNTITIRVDDLRGGGGITGGPVRITPPIVGTSPYLDHATEPHERFDPYLFHRW